MKQLEEKIDNMAVKLRENEEREQKYKDKMAVLEKENSNLNISRDRASNKLAEEQRKTAELEQKLRELNKEIQSAQLKARSEQQRSSERDGKLQTLTNRVRELEIQLADKTAQSDVDSVLVKKMESGGQAIALELDRQKQMNAELVHQNEELRGTCKVLEEELITLRAALEKKKNVSKQAMTDLLNNYKDSERKSMERATECEQLKAQLQSVRHSNCATWRSVNRGYSEDNCIIRGKYLHNRSGYGDSFSMLRTTSSSHDLSIRTSPERAVRFNDHGSDRLLDISSSMEITLRFLKERIEQLERDKTELMNDLKAQHAEMQDNLAKTKDAVGSMQALERKVKELQNVASYVPELLKNVMTSKLVVCLSH
ncbi:hypothetical protein GCK32_013275 [Trichostrongylus colubriformis]|uniref:Uncharacterized protein n=1 Tax=Trichostrongylus colubriformis TaxID=6319 RepID=A0AAN8IUR2_TRICO